MIMGNSQMSNQNRIMGNSQISNTLEGSSSQKIEFVNVNPHALHEEGRRPRSSQNQGEKMLKRSERATNMEQLCEPKQRKHEHDNRRISGEIPEEPHESSHMNFGTDRLEYRDGYRQEYRDESGRVPKDYFFNGDYGYHYQN